MPNPLNVRVLRAGNRIVFDPTTPALDDLLRAALTYTVKVQKVGKKNQHDHDDRGGGVELVTEYMFRHDHRGRLATLLGCYDRLAGVLAAAGYAHELVDLSPHPEPAVLAPQWDRLFDPHNHITLRATQEEFLIQFFARLAQRLPGRFDVATGVGKTAMFGVIAALLPRARIHYASKRAAVMATRIYPELVGALPDVGLVGGGFHVQGQRVQGYTFDSLHHSDGKCDILLVDEVHEAGAPVAAAALAGRYASSLNYGFSASHDMRLDNADMRVEALCGPVVFRVGYAEAADAGVVVPLEVCWTNVPLEAMEGGVDPTTFARANDVVEKKRWAVWRNVPRNRLVAADAARYAGRRQTLVTCETIEHALGLWKELPGFELVYAARDLEPARIRKFQNAGLWPDRGVPRMTTERLANLTAAFEHGRLRGAIVTTVWNVGVSMNHLEVLCRAEASSSPTNDTQIPGRASRLNAGIGKTVGRIHDYKDQFNKGFRQRAGRRATSYRGHGWRQYLPGQWESTPF